MTEATPNAPQPQPNVETFLRGVSPEAPSLTLIPPEEVLKTLRLSNSHVPEDVKSSIELSTWLKSGHDVIEIRNPRIFQKVPGDVAYILDFDDNLASATGWHSEEHRLTAELFAKLGIPLTQEQARDIYDLSKINLPSAIEETRYTPQLNMKLLTTLLSIAGSGQPIDHARSEMLKERDRLKDRAAQEGEDSLDDLERGKDIDPVIFDLFMNNPMEPFVYQEMVKDVLDGADNSDVRIIATRGKIDGPLGQIHKIHSSGLMKDGDLGNPRLDMVIYTNDLKADVLKTLPQFLPWLTQRMIRVYDDNPSELGKYMRVAKQLGLRVELIRVMHPDAKRAKVKMEAEPDVIAEVEPETTQYEHYSINSEAEVV